MNVGKKLLAPIAGLLIGGLAAGLAVTACEPDNKDPSGPPRIARAYLVDPLGVAGEVVQYDPASWRKTACTNEIACDKPITTTFCDCQRDPNTKLCAGMGKCINRPADVMCVSEQECDGVDPLATDKPACVNGFCVNRIPDLNDDFYKSMNLTLGSYASTVRFVINKRLEGDDVEGPPITLDGGINPTKVEGRTDSTTINANGMDVTPRAFYQPSGDLNTQYPGPAVLIATNGGTALPMGSAVKFCIREDIRARTGEVFGSDEANRCAVVQTADFAVLGLGAATEGATPTNPKPTRFDPTKPIPVKFNAPVNKQTSGGMFGGSGLNPANYRLRQNGGSDVMVASVALKDPLTVNVQPAQPLAGDADYTLSVISGSVTDTYGQPIRSTVLEFSFRTSPAPMVTPDAGVPASDGGAGADAPSSTPDGGR
jgi:hypothetical protein